MTRIQQQYPHGRLCAPLLAFACAAAAVGCDGEPVIDPPTTRASALQTAPFVGYRGGKVISNVKPFTVYWGSNVDSTIKSTLPGLYTAIVTSPYMDWLSEYDTYITGGSNQHIGYGTYGGTLQITPMNTATTISASDLEAELRAQIAAAKLPMPDSNTVYMVSFPPGITVTDRLGRPMCQGSNGLAYHDASTFQALPLRYGALPDCGAVTHDRFTLIASHELIEAVTDPDPSGQFAWAEPGISEIGDMCAEEAFPLPGSGIPVQKMWSNQMGACIGFNNGRTFQQADSQHVFVMTTDQNLWFETDPFGAANRQIVDGTALSFQAIGVNDVFVLGIDRKLWSEHAPWGQAPPARQQVDGNVRLFQVIDSQHVLVLGTDGSLWLESGPFGTVPPSRVRVDTGVKAFRGLPAQMSTNVVYVLRNDGTLWVEIGPFGTLSQTRTLVDSKVLAMVPLSTTQAFVLGTDRTLRFERGPWGQFQTRTIVDSPVRSFQAFTGTDVVTLGLDGNLWREHAPFGTLPPAREQVDAVVTTFQFVDLDHILVLDIDGNLFRDEAPFGISIPPAGPFIDSNVTPFGRSTE